jgi:hypothetical protein
MKNMLDKISDYCSSEYFVLLNTDLKEHAESLLSYWCNEVGEEVSSRVMEASLKKVAYLNMPLTVRKGFPELLKEFLGYLSTTGSFPDADNWKQFISQIERKYTECFREDGSVRGETFRKEYTDVGRNDPCPCGSGKKFKKCCMG